MAKETKEVKIAPLLSTNKTETTIDRKLELVGITPFGELMAEAIPLPKGKKTLLNRYIYQDSGDQKICIPITYPPIEIVPDMLYPYREYRMTQQRFNEMDFVPAGGWVKENFRDSNGSLVRDSNGNGVVMYFWCVLKIQELREEEECSYGPVKYVLGEKITKFNEAKNFSIDDLDIAPTVGNTRQRVDDESEIVSV